MSRGPSAFRQCDLTRALRGAQAAGIELARVEISKDGKIVMVPSKVTDACGDALNPWDKVLNAAAEQKRSS